MKKIFFFLLFSITSIAFSQTMTLPSYPTVKLTKLESGSGTDAILTIGVDSKVKKVPKSSIQTDISGKVDKEAGKGLSTNDYTTAEKTKLSGIASGAEVNVNADWNATTGDAQIFNKPSIPSISGLATETYVNSAVSTKENTITAGTTSQYFRGDKTWQTLPTYTLSELGGQPLITAGTTSQYWRGDKTWQTLDKTSVGLVNVDNTTDANKPVSTATQAALNLKENLANKNTANGYAGLGADGKLISNQLPAIAITDTYVINTQAAMLALTAETGDVAIRTDLNKSFILQGATASILSNWQELLSPTGGTTSVFGRTGSVVANAGDYNTSQVTESGNLYYTDARVNANANVSANTAARHNAVTIGTANGLSLSTQALSLGLASSTSNGALSTTDWNTFNGKQNALGFTPYNSTNPNGYISSITSSNVTTALGYTPYNSTNPSGYITSAGRAFPKRSDGSNVNFILSGSIAVAGSPSSILGTANGTDVYNYNTSDLNVNYANTAGSLSSMNISQFANNSGYITGSYLPISGGTVTGTITATAFYASSDRRLKNIISRSGDMIEFTWKDKRDNKTHFGYVAQEVKKKMPDQVNRDEQGYMSVNYIEVLVAKVNALELEVQSLKEKLK